MKENESLPCKLPEYVVHTAVLETFFRADRKAPPPCRKLVVACMRTLKTGGALIVYSHDRQPSP